MSCLALTSVSLKKKNNNILYFMQSGRQAVSNDLSFTVATQESF